MPEDLYSLEAVKVSAGNTNIIQSALVSENYSYADLKKYAEDISDQIATIPGIKEAQAVAYPERELRIAIDIPRLSQLQLSLTRVMSALESENANIPGGSVNSDQRSSTLKQAAVINPSRRLNVPLLVPARDRLYT